MWTGTNPQTVVHAHEDSGVIHCENPHIVVFTSHHALPHYKLDGCRRFDPADVSTFSSVGHWVPQFVWFGMLVEQGLL